MEEENDKGGEMDRREELECARTKRGDRRNERRNRRKKINNVRMDKWIDIRWKRRMLKVKRWIEVENWGMHEEKEEIERKERRNREKTE